MKTENDEMESNLRIENELLKMKLKLEYGAQFSELPNELPAEVENKWLKHIIKFEEANSKGKKSS